MARAAYRRATLALTLLGFVASLAAAWAFVDRAAQLALFPASSPPALAALSRYDRAPTAAEPVAPEITAVAIFFLPAAPAYLAGSYHAGLAEEPWSAAGSTAQALTGASPPLSGISPLSWGRPERPMLADNLLSRAKASRRRVWCVGLGRLVEDSWCDHVYPHPSAGRPFGPDEGANGGRSGLFVMAYGEGDALPTEPTELASRPRITEIFVVASGDGRGIWLRGGRAVPGGSSSPAARLQDVAATAAMLLGVHPPRASQGMPLFSGLDLAPDDTAAWEVANAEGMLDQQSQMLEEAGLAERDYNRVRQDLDDRARTLALVRQALADGDLKGAGGLARMVAEASLREQVLLEAGLLGRRRGAWAGVAAPVLAGVVLLAAGLLLGPPGREAGRRRLALGVFLGGLAWPAAAFLGLAGLGPQGLRLLMGGWGEGQVALLGPAVAVWGFVSTIGCAWIVARLFARLEPPAHAPPGRHSLRHEQALVTTMRVLATRPGRRLLTGLLLGTLWVGVTAGLAVAAAWAAAGPLQDLPLLPGAVPSYLHLSALANLAGVALAASLTPLVLTRAHGDLSSPSR